MPACRCLFCVVFGLFFCASNLHGRFRSGKFCFLLKSSIFFSFGGLSRAARQSLEARFFAFVIVAVVVIDVGAVVVVAAAKACLLLVLLFSLVYKLVTIWRSCVFGSTGILCTMQAARIRSPNFPFWGMYSRTNVRTCVRACVRRKTGEWLLLLARSREQPRRPRASECWTEE